ncbi:hypothetical protein [Mucilaginibacter limnophilus]|uniref:hypothetical protein n=1 Tax=Mucilaginibacter limnophilus TaxID=1932778 RepID=UPI001F0BA71A|nr:hypothetical protein [Mucilaginibacter limnophilus]
MKKLFFLLLFFACAGYASAQVLYIDPATSSAIFAHSSAINGQLNTTNNNLTAIQRGQLAVSGQLTIVNDLQNKILKA